MVHAAQGPQCPPTPELGRHTQGPPEKARSFRQWLPISPIIVEIEIEIEID